MVKNNSAKIKPRQSLPCTRTCPAPKVGRVGRSGGDIIKALIILYHQFYFKLITIFLIFDRNINAMKKLVILLFVLISTAMVAQNKQQYSCGYIFYGSCPGVAPYKEYCWFDTASSFIVIDTTNLTNIWQIGLPQKTIFNSAYSVPNVIVTDTVNNYPVNNLSYFDLIIPSLGYSLLGWNTCVSFKHKIYSDTMMDGGYIEVKYHKDSAWKNIAYDTLHYSQGYLPMEFNCENLYRTNDTLFDGTPGFSGTSDWVTTQLQWIWSFMAKEMYVPDTLRLRFNFISDSVNTNKEGWMIDNLEITVYPVCGSIEEINSENLISVSPNPVSESALVELKIKDNESYTAELYNIFGQKIKDFPEIKNNRFTIERGNCESGMYFLILKKENNLLASKKILFQ